MNFLLETAITAAKEAGKIQLDHLGKDIDITHKGVVDLVTKVDKLCERNIISILSEAFPDHSFLAEEENHEIDPDAKYRWIIDPLDGTTNYAHSYRFFCTSIALENVSLSTKNYSEIVLGVVYDPVTDELFHAEKGKGAFLNNKTIKVSNTSDLSNSLLSTGFPYDIRESKDNNFDHFKKFALTAQAIRRDGAAALDLCYLACGRFDGFWELKLKPWDLAAGTLIVKEAGGRVTNFNNEELDIYNDDVLASNNSIHDEMITILNDN
ncbi:inositol monophosphatase family protein [Thermodesulfobacteriota bacterium]